MKEFSRVLSLKDPLGITVYYMLLKSKGERPDMNVKKLYPDTLEIEIREYLLYRNILSPYLDVGAVSHLDTFLMYYFNRKLQIFVDDEKKKGEEAGAAISKFCDAYEIFETDISFEALKKAEYRYRIDKLNSLKIN